MAIFNSYASHYQRINPTKDDWLRPRIHWFLRSKKVLAPGQPFCRSREVGSDSCLAVYDPWTIYWLDSCLGKYYIRRSLGCVPFLVNTNSFGIKHCSSLNLFKSIPSKIDMYFQDGSSMMFSPYFAYLYISHFSGIFCLCDVLYNNWYNCPKLMRRSIKPFCGIIKAGSQLPWPQKIIHRFWAICDPSIPSRVAGNDLTRVISPHVSIFKRCRSLDTDHHWFVHTWWASGQVLLSSIIFFFQLFLDEIFLKQSSFKHPQAVPS